VITNLPNNHPYCHIAMSLKIIVRNIAGTDIKADRIAETRLPGHTVLAGDSLLHLPEVFPQARLY